MKTIYYMLLIAAMLLPQPKIQAQTNLGSGSYYNSAPGPNSNEGPLVTTNFDQPIITTDWWTSILWSKWQNPYGYSNIMHPHPFSYRCQSDGLVISHQSQARVYNGNVGTSFENNYNFDFAQDLRVSLENVTFPDTRAEEYSD